MAVAEAKTRAEPEEPALVRCHSCLGLRSLSHRNRDSAALCGSCRRGEAVPRENYYAWWLERFSAEECAAMACAIWGTDATGGAWMPHPYLPPAEGGLAARKCEQARLVWLYNVREIRPGRHE